MASIHNEDRYLIYRLPLQESGKFKTDIVITYPAIQGSQDLTYSLSGNGVNVLETNIIVQPKNIIMINRTTLKMNNQQPPKKTITIENEERIYDEEKLQALREAPVIHEWSVRASQFPLHVLVTAIPCTIPILAGIALSISEKNIF